MLDALTLAPLLALLAAAPAAPQDAPEAGTFEVPPPASKEDVALWWRGRNVDVDLPVERGVSTRLQAEVNGSGWTERLEEAVRRGALDRKHAERLATKLRDEWNELALVLSFRWPVDPIRVCSYPFIAFDNALTVKETPSEVALHRGRLLECVEKASRILAELRHRNAEYRQAFEKIDRSTPPLAEVQARRDEPTPRDALPEPRTEGGVGPAAATSPATTAR